MKDQIIHVKGFMHEDDYKKIYEYAVKNDELFSEFGNSEQEFKVHIRGQIDQIDPEINRVIESNAKRVYDFVREKYSETDFAPFDETKTHIARFGAGAQMHEHFDSSRPNDIATLIYINDDYEGGEIYFPDYDVSIKPQSGDLVCFPDNPSFIHGVRVIISGVRYTTPRWFTRIV
jgi:predicted 2-oxoglutarate/Fe(II)-dependent dioxygenase YbiX